MKFLRCVDFLLALVFVAAMHASATAQAVTIAQGSHVAAQHLTAELIPAAPSIAPGGTATMGLKLSLEPGWHVYWSNPGDSGEPPVLTWKLPQSVTVDALQFPVPKRLPLGPLVDYGYDGVVVFPFAVHAAAALGPGTLPLQAKLSWLVCREVCIPGTAQLHMSLLVGPSRSRMPAGSELEGALAKLPVRLPPSLSLSVSSSPAAFVLNLKGVPPVAPVQFYPLEPEQVANAAAQITEPAASGIRLRLVRASIDAPLPARLRGLLKTVDGKAYQFDVPVTPMTAASGRAATNMTALVALGLAFAGGVLLNLMPCVFPVLFIKGLALVQSSEEERSRLRRHGLVYGAGILLSFWCLVAVLLVLRATGAEAGWGFQLQSPFFIAILACLLFFLALSLAGQFDIGLSLTSKGGSLAAKPGYGGSFFTGILATVVATPCMGPFLGAAVGFALAQPPSITFAVFTAMALGLASPYILLTAQPAAIRILPKPGAWMEIFKQVTAVPLFATVIWLTWIYARLFVHTSEGSPGPIAKLLSSFLLVAAAGWVLGRWPMRRSSTAAALLIGCGAVLLLMTKAGSEPRAWQPYSQTALDVARSQHRPVFLDFTAAWCLSCQFNERTVLRSEAVAEQLRSHDFVLLRADWTAYNPAITSQLAAVGRSGVPTYVIYPASPGSAADVLPEMLTKSAVLAAIERDTR